VGGEYNGRNVLKF